ncbi:DMT family transporter [Rhodomicrobium vannielii]|uniref:DMT family transporter n=1 Tax=Rhodomicrobium vannielii TaxID=1069 RepID=UPI001FF035E5|nr:DMT family transporter [Rhodomicrobium vannielii]
MTDLLTKPAATAPASAAQRPSSDRRLVGIGFMLTAVSFFAFLDTSAKFLGTIEHIPVVEIIWVRFLMNAVLIVVMLGPRGVMRAAPSKKPGQQILRSALLLATTAFNFAALQFLQLDQTSTIYFLAPFFVAALAGPLLGEWVGWHRLAAICVGFTGIIFVTKPGFGGIHWAVALALGSVFCHSLYSLWTRYLARFDAPRTTLVYTPLAGAVIMAPVALWNWQMPPDALAWGILLSMGLLGGMGHWFLILAHDRAPAPVIAPFTYINLLLVTCLGYLVFGDVPDIWTLVGAAIIVASGIYLLFRERAASASAPASSSTVDG